MKHLLKLLLVLFVISSCTTTKLVNHWKNPDIDTFKFNKVLIVGITSNKKARIKFEKKLKKKYEERGIEAVISLDFLDPKITSSEQSEAELIKIESKLVADGFDAILLTKVVGIEDRVAFNQSYNAEKNINNDFFDEYYKYQNIYYKPNYYEEYSVYQAETSLYCICATENRNLLWKGYIDIINPTSIQKTISDYVNLIIFALEEKQLINSINIRNLDL